jgi:hypothetical protein
MHPILEPTGARQVLWQRKYLYLREHVDLGTVVSFKQHPGDILFAVTKFLGIGSQVPLFLVIDVI